MEIKNREIEGVSIFDIDGEIDLYNAPNIKKEVENCMQKGNKKITINLKNVSYIDSSGIGALISILSNLKKVGGELKLLHVYDSVKKVFELTKLTSFFQIYENEDEVIADFNS